MKLEFSPHLSHLGVQPQLGFVQGIASQQPTPLNMVDGDGGGDDVNDGDGDGDDGKAYMADHCSL